MPVEMVLIRHNWHGLLTKYHAVIDCAKENVRIPVWARNPLISWMTGSKNKRGTDLKSSSCTKAPEVLLCKDCHVFLAHITDKETGTSSRRRPLKDCPQNSIWPYEIQVMPFGEGQCSLLADALSRKNEPRKKIRAFSHDYWLGNLPKQNLKCSDGHGTRKHQDEDV
ncbi:hypothetical protein Tco_0311812 [Tanacetum coccineum]